MESAKLAAVAVFAQGVPLFQAVSLSRELRSVREIGEVEPPKSGT